MRPDADTAFVWTGATCSYGCGACPIDPQTAPAGVQEADLSRALADIPERHGRLVVLLGGEPFVRPDFLRLMAVIRAAGCAPGIVTTGRPLLYPQWRERLRRAGLAYLRVQLFGVGESHDREAAVPGAFDQAIAGLQAWIADGTAACDVEVALNVRRRPLDTIVAEVESLRRAIGSPSVRIVVAIEEATDDDARAAESLRAALAALESSTSDAACPSLAWENLPPALAGVSRQAAPALSRVFAGVAPEACCLGKLRPQTTCANSFNFVRRSISVPFAADATACTAHESAGGGDPRRQLWLVEDDRLVLHETDTGDFTAAEIVRVKDEWSHVLLDRQPAGVLDDFTEGMRRVLPDPTCDACPHRAHCGRRFRIADGPPYAREEAWIAAYVANLRGRVLDVGCGEQLYRSELAPLLRSGVVQYTGLDPDEVSLERIRAALPEGRYHIGGIEEFRGQPASYEHILSLRSLNHVADLDTALARMAELLAPGGSLLIVECTPFAMLRRPEQVAAADQAPRAGHQHFRNVASDDVLPCARSLGLVIRHHHPAGLRTTNQWILQLSRAAEA